MAEQFKAGDKVRWSSHGGTARGRVVRKVEKPMTIKGNRVAASPENPEYLVETEEGKRAAHKPEALRKA